MFLDWLEPYLTTCPLYLQEMGYLREVQGIRKRYKRWRSVWENHCRRSKELILKAANGCLQHRKVVVFGSGWLHDVPLEELAQQFEEVLLVDLFHPLRTRWQMKKFPNVKLFPLDVTGVIEAAWKAAHDSGASLPISNPTFFQDDPSVDLVVSLNILSQLPCMPEHYLRRLRAHPAHEILSWCRSLIQAHLNYLRQFQSVVCLISDVEVRTITEKGAEISRSGTLYNEPFPYVADQWIWTLVPRRDTPPHHGEQLVVLGVENIHKAHPA